MSKMTIRGAEHPIKKIFSDDFFFRIPLYQRAYAWTTEESEQLLEDLLRAMEGDDDSIDELPPYFLGSIVLIKSDDNVSESDIVGGQQRLTTLTMLLATIRSLIKSEYVDGLTSFLCEKGNVVTGIPRRYRLRLRERDAEFFQKYIQDEDAIKALKKLEGLQLPDSQRNIRDNTIGFVRELEKLSENQLISLTQFIVNRCFLIVVTVSDPNLDSAYRIFSVLNGRGLNLSYSDILKAEIISKVQPDKQNDYVTKWEEMESNILGSETFDELFTYLRAIFSRKRPMKGMIEEFKQYVFPGNPPVPTPQEFIDKILLRYGHALNNIVKANYQGLPMSKEIKSKEIKEIKEINNMFKWLNQLDHKKWIPPALFYFSKNWHQPQQVLRFLVDLERLVISFMICRVPPYRRMDRYYDLLQYIHEEKDLYTPDSPLQLKPRECADVLKALSGNMYFIPHVCCYVLLRLDSRLSEGVASYDFETISVEHILPQRPAPNSNWVKMFPTQEMREKYVHRLGNLVLLSSAKNLRAENYDFDEKKYKYFRSDGGISPFALTTDVLHYQEWTPIVIDQRQRKLIGMLKHLWRL